MSLSKKDKKDLKIYRDLKSPNLDGILLPFKGSDKIPEEMIENEIPKWCPHCKCKIYCTR